MRLKVQTGKEKEQPVPINVVSLYEILNDFTKLDAQTEVGRLAQVQPEEIYQFL